MRHLFSLGRWEGWDEHCVNDYNGVGNGEGEDEMDLNTGYKSRDKDRLNVWREYVGNMAETDAEEEE